MLHRDDDKLRVQDATDIVRLVGEQVSLRPKGREFAGLCPFHDDKTPSMFVSPAKQIYKCFSCGAGGDVFSFVMNYHKMSFPEAIKHLAERAGIELTPWQGGPGQASDGPSERDVLREANERALGFFCTLLKHPEHGRVAREYIEKRGINAQMVEEFQIGVAPDLWDGLAKMIGSKGWETRGFIAAGLVSVRGQNPQSAIRNPQSADCYDRLRHRLIFPICDAIGRPIAFGGRVLPGSTRDDASDAKYLNSPETKLFNKSATLYGLHLAKKPIIDSRTAIVVEGYTDVIACHQAGERNVVATLGTSLTREHVTELRRYCDKVVVTFDADVAGQKAADRAVEVFLTGDLDVAVATPPGGLDPADLLALPDGLEQWRRAIAEAQDALAHQLDRVKQQLEAAGTVTGRQKIAEAYIIKLAELGLTRTASLRRSFVIQRLCSLLHLSENAITALLREHTPRPRPRNFPQKPTTPGGTPAPGSIPGTSPGSTPGTTPESGSATPQYAGELELEPAPHDLGAHNPFNDDHDGVSVPGRGTVDYQPASATMKAVALAERQVIGALIRDNGLFHRQMPDGHAFDEVLVPEDFGVSSHRQLFVRIHDRLAEGRAVTLASVLGDLAAELEAEARVTLSNTLTQADIDVERGSLGKPEKVCELFDLAVDRLRAVQADRDYQTTKDERLEKLAGTENDVTLNAAVMDDLKQRMAARANPGRILRRK